MIHYSNPYGVKAKKAYKRYLRLGYDASMILPGQVLEVDKNWWKTSNIQSLNDISQLADTVKASKNKLIQDIPEMQKKGSLVVPFAANLVRRC
eukprot:SAG22_NODE_1240_length_5042_cov_103.645964_12_plen_93_part_00